MSKSARFWLVLFILLAVLFVNVGFTDVQAGLTLAVAVVACAIMFIFS